MLSILLFLCNIGFNMDQTKLNNLEDIDVESQTFDDYVTDILKNAPKDKEELDKYVTETLNKMPDKYKEELLSHEKDLTKEEKDINVFKPEEHINTIFNEMTDKTEGNFDDYLNNKIKSLPKENKDLLYDYLIKKHLPEDKLNEKTEYKPSTSKPILSEEKQPTSIDDYLKSISQLESSGGKNLEHKEITQGIHKGTRAIGRFGLMANTVDEIVKRSKLAGKKDSEYDKLLTMSPEEKKKYIEQNPDLEYRLAKDLASHIFGKYEGDELKAAYAWKYGHNLPEETIEARKYLENPYVKSYKKEKEKLALNNKKWFSGIKSYYDEPGDDTEID